MRFLFITMMLTRRLIGLDGSFGSSSTEEDKPDDARDAFVIHSAGDQLAARGVAAVCRQLPVAVTALASRIGRGIGVAGQADAVRHLVDELADLAQDLARVRLAACALPIANIGRFCSSTIWMRRPSRRDVDQQLVLELAQRRAGRDRRIDLGLELVQQLTCPRCGKLLLRLFEIG